MEITATRYGEQFVLIHGGDGDAGLITAMEAYPFVGRARGAVMRLLAQAVANATAPDAIASEVDRLLAADPTLPTQVSFAAAASSGDVCVAGTLRAHQIRGDSSSRSSEARRRPGSAA